MQGFVVVEHAVVKLLVGGSCVEVVDVVIVHFVVRFVVVAGVVRGIHVVVVVG